MSINDLDSKNMYAVGSVDAEASEASEASKASVPRKRNSRRKLGSEEAYTFSQILGAKVRKKRLEANLTIWEASALCDVGHRFLIDLEMGKPSVQLEKAVSVAKKLGLRLTVTDSEASVGDETSKTDPVWLSFGVPEGITQQDHYLLMRHAAHYVASHSKVPVLPCELVRQAGRLTCLKLDVSSLMMNLAPNGHIAPVARSGENINDVYFARFTGERVREEQGGMGLKKVFAFIREHSTAAALDTENVLRWVVLSNALMGYDVHAGHVVLMKEGGRVRLAPFTSLMAYTKLFQMPDYRGFKIGSSWSEIHLRMDHWTALAQQAEVHPKVLFQIMREYSSRVPGLFEEALIHSMGSLPRFGTIISIISEIRKSCERMGDLLILASHKVAGLKNDRQPKVVPIEPKLIIQSRKPILASDDDF